ncbi:MAG: hypothetical protein Q8O67_07815 [Deltaproteobacteria bacterium]|nr:hypothetical protein [Deltaproteobacteria bacterium]
MPRENLDNLMGRFKNDDYSMKLCNAIFSVVPGVEPMGFYETFGDAVRTVTPSSTPEQVDKAYKLTQEEDPQEALWVLDALDTGDKGIALYTGFKSAFNMFFGSSKTNPNRFESDPQQATDAALKGLGLAYAIVKLFPGTVPEKIAQFNRVPAGKHILTYYAVMELAVPFTDNALNGSGNLMQDLMSKFGKDSGAKMAALAGAAGAEEATSVLTQITGQLNELTGKVAQFVGPVTDKVKAYMPGALGAADKVGGIVATGADLMPIWGLLGTRLVAEACALRFARSGG